MNVHLRVCAAVSVAVVGITFTEATAQSAISDSDVARLRAFIGSTDIGSTEFDASSRSASASPSSGAVIGGVYKVRSGDTLSEIMATHLGNTGVNHDVMQKVIVKNNKSAFRQATPLVNGGSIATHAHRYRCRGLRCPGTRRQKNHCQQRRLGSLPVVRLY